MQKWYENHLFISTTWYVKYKVHFQLLLNSFSNANSYEHRGRCETRCADFLAGFRLRCGLVASSSKGSAMSLGVQENADENLTQSKGCVDACLAGVVTKDNMEMESWPVLSWKLQVSGTTIKA